MAIIRTGSLISGIRGSVGGNTFSRGRSGAFVRTRTKPTNAPSNLQGPYKGAMSTVYDYWLNTVTAPQREAWNTLGTNTVFTNRLGDTYNPSGWNLFFRSNALAFRFEVQTPFAVAPVSAVATTYPIVFTSTTPSITIRATADAAWDNNTVLFFWVTSVRHPTVFYSRGPYIQEIHDDASVFKPGIGLPFGPYITGDRVFLRTRGLTSDGQVTARAFHTFDVTTP